MKISEFRKLIKEEIRKVLKEADMSSPKFKKIAGPLVDAMVIDCLDNYDDFDEWLEYGMKNPNEEVQEYLDQLSTIASSEEIDKFMKKVAIPAVKMEVEDDSSDSNEPPTLGSFYKPTTSEIKREAKAFNDMINYAKKLFGSRVQVDADKTYFEVKYPKPSPKGQYYATFELKDDRVFQGEAINGTFPRGKGSKVSQSWEGTGYYLPSENGVSELDGLKKRSN
jgi:hypothetical protein